MYSLSATKFTYLLLKCLKMHQKALKSIEITLKAKPQ